MIIILYNLLVKITIVPILIFFFPREYSACRMTNFADPKRHARDLSFTAEGTIPQGWHVLSLSLFIFYYYYYFWCMHFISKMSLCKRSLSVGLVALDIFQSKKPTLKQSRVDLNVSLENPSLHIGLPIWRQK